VERLGPFIRIALSRIRGLGLAAAVGAFLPGCAEMIETSRQLKPTTGLNEWTDLHRLDLSDISPGLSSSDCGTDSQKRTFEDFKLVSDSGKAVLVASLCEESNGNPVARPYGRVYHARGVERTGLDGSLLVNGWSASGADFQALAGTSLGNVRDVTAAISPEGEVRALFWDLDDSSGSDSAEATWREDTGWGSRVTGSLSEAGTTLEGIDLDQGSGTLELFDGVAATDAQSYDGAFDLWNGSIKDLIWDASGRARVAILNAGAPEVRLADPSSAEWGIEAADFSPSSSALSPQLRLIDDGFRTVLLWIAGDPFEDRTSPATTSKLYAMNSDETSDFWKIGATAVDHATASPNDAHALNRFSNGLTRAFSAATDRQGTIVAVYISKHSDELAVTCSSLAANCDFRLYASVQSPNGLWTGPMPLDEAFVTKKKTTTYAQESEDDFDGSDPTLNLDFSAVQPGLEFATPQVTYIGNGKFLVAAVLSDYTTTDAPETIVFSRVYTVGAGWDATSATLQVDDAIAHSAHPDTDVFSTYRPVNEIKLASNQEGQAVLLMQVTDPDSSDQGDPELRTWIHQAYIYQDGSGWSDPEAFPDEIPCPALANQDPDDDGTLYLTGCAYGRMELAQLTGGESVAVFSAPDSTNGNPLRLGLFGSELREYIIAEEEDDE
jgi:hypothetical protein